MKPVITITIAVGISVVSVFVISEIIWYFANQEFEKARDELKESLADIFEKQYESISEQKESTNISSQECSGTAQCIRGTISQIIDGDTIKVNGESIRFALSSAPELKAYGGTESKNFIETICPVGSDVLIDEDDGQILGSYGRMVGVVYCNGVNLNSELLDADLGYLEVRFCDSSEFADEPWAKKHGCTTDSKVTSSSPQVLTQSNCDSSYPDFCIPSSPPDLDCGDISQKRFTVLQPDPHRFDGDKDGIGCES